ncbi:hypothetical protein [Microbacterium testaceum]|nr:hypothetical protein [Microbacterium testaceum]
MRMSTGLAARLVVATTGCLLLMGTASAAYANQVGSGTDVDVSVDIAPVVAPGSLTLTVAGTTAALAETSSGSAAQRAFAGDLPKVTVTDTRTAAEISSGLTTGQSRWWYVTGQATAFSGPSGATIPAANLGWTPALVGSDGDGNVAPGDVVVPHPDAATNSPADDNNTGLVSGDLLYAGLDSAALVSAGQTQSSATAHLLLKAPATVAPGEYHSTLTLSLFEDVN